MSSRATLPAILAISFALLVDEIMLSAIFHVLLGAGNTVAAIAIALVGLSAGGIVAYSFPSLARSLERPGLLLLAFALSLPLCVYAIMAVPLHHGDLIYHRDEAWVQLWRLFVHHVTVLPFFLGGLTISLLFRSAPARIGALYAADLLGAALGCVASPALLTAVGAPGAVLCAAVPAALIGAGQVLRRGGAVRWLAPLALLLLLLPLWRPQLLAFARISTMGEVEHPAYRGFAIGPGDIDYERWALDAWTIIRGDEIPQQWEHFRGWGLSPDYDGPVPETRLINYNARFSTYVTRRDAPERLGPWLDADLSSLHHAIGRRFASVLNIGAGGGREVLAALHHGAERVVAIDVSEVVVEDLMKGELREFSGDLYLDPRVEAIADEGRSYSERTRERFDLIEFSIVGGMNLEKMDLVRVDDLFTAEALETYLSRLRPDGVFSYVMYSTRSDIVDELVRSGDVTAQPYIPALRTFAGLRLALEALEPGARFADHALVAVLPGVINPRYDLVHIAIGRAPFSERERGRFLEACRRLRFLCLHPGEAPDGNVYARVATAPDLGGLFASIPFGIRPPTDDRPFQYSLDPGELRRALVQGDLFELLASNPLVSLGTSIAALAALLTVAPLLASRQRRVHLERLAPRWRLLLYFACIGFAYMGVEIAALLRLQSYLGKPIYGLSVGLFAFLLASGLGSAWTRRIDDTGLERGARLVVAVVIGVGLLFVAGASQLLSGTIAWSLPARIALSVAIVLPLALPMGMLFPIGIRLLARSSEELVPWAWATNGCFSVIGIFSTRVVALIAGFSRAMLIALVIYALVALCVRARSAPSG